MSVNKVSDNRVPVQAQRLGALRAARQTAPTSGVLGSSALAPLGSGFAPLGDLCPGGSPAGPQGYRGIVRSGHLVHLGCQTIMLWENPGNEESGLPRTITIRHEQLGETWLTPEEVREFGELLIRLTDGKDKE